MANPSPSPSPPPDPCEGYVPQCPEPPEEGWPEYCCVEDAECGCSPSEDSDCECACIWAVLNGHREFVCLIGSDEGHAMDMLDSIKTELDANELLLANYPEVCHPIQSLDGIANRCNSQLYHGERTHIGWTAKYIVLPTLRPQGWSEEETLGALLREDGRALASGAIIKVAGITGRIRGMKFKRPDGKSVRPSLVVLDRTRSRVERVEFACNALFGQATIRFTSRFISCPPD